MLTQAMQYRGIPTWQDVDNLEEEHTATESRRVLAASSTANAVMWITPNVADSSFIQKVEVPAIMERAEAHDSFFVIPVAAGGAVYATASEAAGADLSLTTLQEWNIRKLDSNPAAKDEIRAIANRVLSRRVVALHKTLGNDEPIQIGIFARTTSPSSDTFWLSINWSDAFTHRHAQESEWQGNLLPAIDDVVSTIEKHASGRTILLSGRPTIAAAFALGQAFLAPRGLDARWVQATAGQDDTFFGLNVSQQPTDLSSTSRDSDTSAEDLAVLVSVNASVEHAFAASRASLPSFRGIVHVRYEADDRHTLSPAKALDIAQNAVTAIREAREKFRPKGAMLLFMALPVGLAFLIGQLSNTLGPIRLYEHEETDAVGRYLAGPRLGTHFAT